MRIPGNRHPQSALELPMSQNLGADWGSVFGLLGKKQLILRAKGARRDDSISNTCKTEVTTKHPRGSARRSFVWWSFGSCYSFVAFSLFSRSSFRLSPQRYPPRPPSLRTTRWQGISTATLLVAQARATARRPDSPPSLLATCE